MEQCKYLPDNGAMLNAYPDSMGGTLHDIVCFLRHPDLKDVFRSFYILPSLFNTDLDRGFSVIDYQLNELFAKQEDIDAIRSMKLDLKLDFICNHLSVLSNQFQDILKHGDRSEYKDFFIDWNRFWAGNGTMTPQGYIQPDEYLIREMFFRKPGLPLLMVRLPDGTETPYWNTFYQEVRYDKVDAHDLMLGTGMQYATAVKVSAIINLALEEGKNPLEITFGQYEKYAVSAVDYLESRRKYLGQMDLNINSPKVWRFFAETIKKLAGYGASIVRLDAFAYMSKKAGAKNFLNEPETFELLSQIKKIADEYNLSLLPEIHAGYADKTYQKLAQDGYMIYDFFLPGLVLDALERKNADRLAAWADELREKKIRAVNMLGCHDGIPLLDLKGLIPDEEIESLIQTIIGRGGFIKNLHGNKNLYYQVSSTYYSALGEDNKKMLLARAIQLFMPGKPQVWYLDLFLGKNNHDAVRRAGESGHREINRTSLSAAEVEEGLKLDAVRKQLEMLRFRNTFPAFGFESEFKIKIPATHEIEVCWRRHGYLAVLRADLSDCSFVIEGTTDSGKAAFSMSL